MLCKNVPLHFTAIMQALTDDMKTDMHAVHLCNTQCYVVCLTRYRGKGDAERLCGMDCPGRQGVPPSLHCEMCMCMFHPECVGYSDRAARGGFICKVSLLLTFMWDRCLTIYASM